MTAGCWKDRCLEEYKDYTPSDWDQSSWKALLLNVYIPWGRLIGLWQANSQPYGGLVVVVAEPPKLVSAFANAENASSARFARVLTRALTNARTHAQVGYSIVNARVSVSETFESIPTFEIDCKSRRVHCLRTNSQKENVCVSRCHSAEIELAANTFRLSCEHQCDHDNFERRIRKDCIMQHIGGTSSAAARERLHAYYFHYLHEAVAFDLWNNASISEEGGDDAENGKAVLCDRLMTSRTPKSLDGKPTHKLEGLWQGSYGAHGVEFVEIRLEGRQLVAHKITGDPNVWAGKVSFMADIDDMVQFDDGYRVNALEEDLGTTRLSQEWPDSADRAYEVRVRMRGKGQIAEFGFKNPQWTPAEIIVFVEDNFAVYWPELQSVSLFQRVNLEAIKPSSS